MVQSVSDTPQPDSGRVRSVQLELERDVHAPMVARAAVGGLCHDLGCPPAQCHALTLLVSEVISNAVLHSRAPAGAPIVLAATVGESKAFVAVVDAGEGFTPNQLETNPEGGGYGLYLLDRVASRWGVDQTGGTRVWFELPVGG